VNKDRNAVLVSSAYAGGESARAEQSSGRRESVACVARNPKRQKTIRNAFSHGLFKARSETSDADRAPSSGDHATRTEVIA
jgi:hypothetical protein